MGLAEPRGVGGGPGWPLPGTAEAEPNNNKKKKKKNNI